MPTPTKTAKPSIMEKTINLGSQDVTAKQILTVADHKVWLSVKSDAYASQCHAIARVWNPTELKWNLVYSIHYSEMKTPKGLCYLPNKTGLAPTHFTEDFAKLLNITGKILQ